jgi:hypothetical protein
MGDLEISCGYGFAIVGMRYVRSTMYDVAFCIWLDFGLCRDVYGSFTEVPSAGF